MTPLFTPQQIKDDGQTRVVKTGGQVGVASALVGLGAAFCDRRGWLHGPLDPVGFGEWVTLVSVFLSAATNYSRLRGKA